jgi:hypothetical protein
MLAVVDQPKREDRDSGHRHGDANDETGLVWGSSSDPSVISVIGRFG